MSPLSPLIAGISLAPLDTQLNRAELFYVRFMDDWIVFANTRHHLRRAVRITHKTLAALRLQQHPAKTFTGRIERGFDFLGYHFSPVGLCPAQTILENYFANLSRFYEQPVSASVRAKHMGDYANRRLAWLLGGLGWLRLSALSGWWAELKRMAICAGRRKQTHFSPSWIC